MNQQTTEVLSPTEKAAAPAATKLRRGAHTAPVAPPRRPTRTQAGGAKAHAKRASRKAGAVRRAPAAGSGTSKTEKILTLLKRSGGTTLKELIKATGWQPHSVRGFLSGVVTKKLKLKVASVKDDAGVRRYSVKS